MPLVDPRAGRAFIWIVTSFLFFSIIAGGGCLLMYMILPESETTAWLPIAGLSFVCLPWFFWFLTFIYRILSRTCGFRVSFGGNDAGSAAGAASAAADPAGEGENENNDQRRSSSSSEGSARSRESEMPFAIAVGS